jgi:uncharacterized C2H2 Zn-finger protein
MPGDLLGSARRQAERADPSVRAAALLRIARAESAGDVSRARSTLLHGLDLVSGLPDSARGHLFNEARRVAAAVSPELLDEIPISRPHQFASGNLVRVMLAHGHRDAAVNYLLHYDDPASFPFGYVGNVLYELHLHSPDSAARRMIVLRHAVEMWRSSPTSPHHHEHGQFVRLFGHAWKEFPPEEAIAVVHAIIERARDEPDAGGSYSYSNEIEFTSPRQHTLFEVLHVLRHLDPALAQSLIDCHDQLAAAVRRYPNGLETLMEELKVKAERRKAAGATCQGGGYVTGGDPADFDRQRRLIDATRSGDFEPSIKDAIEKYRVDTSPETRNYAPKEYWPSTGAFRTMFYKAGIRLGADAAKLLERIPDDDLRLFATMELAAALAGVPESSITNMKQPRPLNSSSPGGRIVDARLIQGRTRIQTRGPKMRSPDGRIIRCPKCLFRPPADFRWTCNCGHFWNTFSTAGNCPACHFQWEVTACPRCGEMSEHRAWYASEP